MRYALIRPYDIANGPGIRTTIFFSGCLHHCKNCFNKEFQDFDYGNEWDKESEDHFINCVKNEHVAGVSILGGEPFQQESEKIEALLKRIKEETGKSIWLWTGYLYENIPVAFTNALKYIDVIVDGPFIEAYKDLNLFYRGSSNQRVIDNIQTLLQNRIVEKI